MQELRTNWTQEVFKQQKGKIFVPITLSDMLIDRLEELCKAKKRKAKGVRTSWSGKDKQVMMEVHRQLNSKYSSCLVRVLPHIEFLSLPALLKHRVYIQTSLTASDSLFFLAAYNTGVMAEEEEDLNMTWRRSRKRKT